jgi:hypothetical protein
MQRQQTDGHLQVHSVELVEMNEEVTFTKEIKSVAESYLIE